MFVFVMAVFITSTACGALKDSVPAYDGTDIKSFEDLTGNIANYRYVIVVDVGNREEVLIYTPEEPEIFSSKNGGILVKAVNVFCPKKNIASNLDRRDDAGCREEEHYRSLMIFSPAKVTIIDRS